MALNSETQFDGVKEPATPQAAQMEVEPSTPRSLCEGISAAEARLESGKNGKPIGPGIASQPIYALILLLVIAASAGGVAIFYLSSRHAVAEKTAIEEFQQSLHRMEQRLASRPANVPASSASADRPLTTATSRAALLDAADVQYREGRFPEAASSFRAAAEADTAGQLSDEAHYRYGQCLLKTGKTDGALREFQAVVIGFPGSPHFAAAAMEAARLLMDQRKEAQARRTLYQLVAARDRLSAADKDYVEHAYFMIARCFESEADSLERQPRSSNN